MGTIIVACILIVLIIAAVIAGKGHFKGEGGCCGGGGEILTEEPEKQLQNPVIARKRIRISGMHCDACRNRVEHRLNQITGVSCKVDLEKKEAIVQMDCEVSDALLINAIQGMDYKVESVEDI